MACKYLIALALPIMFFGMFFGKPLMLFLYGNEYLQAVDAWKILIFSVGFMFLWSIFIVLLNAIDHPKVPLKGVTIGTIVNVSLNLFLIPKYGYLGASASTVVAEIILFSFLLYSLNQYGYPLNLMKHSLKPVLASLLCVFIIFVMPDINIILIVVVSGGSYLLFLVMFGFFGPSEIKLFHELKGSIKNRLFQSAN